MATNSGDSYWHKLCSTYNRLIFILLREGFYVKLQKSKRFDLIDKYSDTFQFLPYSQSYPYDLPRMTSLSSTGVDDKLHDLFRAYKHYDSYTGNDGTTFVLVTFFVCKKICKQT